MPEKLNRVQARNVLVDPRIYEEIARDYLISTALVSLIKNGHAYKWATGTRKAVKHVRGTPRRAVPDSVVRAIYRCPLTIAETAAKFDVTLATVKNIRYGQYSYGDVVAGLTPGRPVRRNKTYFRERSLSASQVRAIFVDPRPSREIAEANSVSVVTVNSIKSGRRYPEHTKGLTPVRRRPGRQRRLP